ncbi:sulfotransferase family protein [Pseudofrankia saprophytica]|uniref:sulfotransferase family protein n=1 Tax=Pseudofrankia saprophytica TaxID=298655 RepID=UPI000234B20C|nr:sulfotransferase [Pseudofrankia saprophytica]
MNVDDLLAGARDATGLSDFGDDELFGGDLWRDALARLLASLEAEARLSELGRAIVASEQANYLTTRLRVVDHHRAHPEIRERGITPPIVIVGQARTGTTMLHDVLAQDAAHRAPLTWEVDLPLPPPRTETYLTDPRIAQVDATFELVDQVIPEFRAVHQLGARLAQECSRIAGGSFVSVIFPTQFHIPAYLDWLLHDAVRDGHHAAAYVWHRRYLELLQSEHPGERWLVKSPAHVWTLPQLLAEYPGALLVQTHRDPARVMASTASMLFHLRRLYSDDVRVAELGPEFSELILDGLERSAEARLDGTIRSEQVVDVQFRDLMADPLGTARAIYGAFGFELTDDAEARIAGFLRDNPRERWGGHEYTFADTALDLAAVRQRTARYSKQFGVPEEVL